LGYLPQSIVELLVFYHTTEHLPALQRWLLPDQRLLQAWFKQAERDLKQGRICDLINQMHSMVKKAKVGRREFACP